MSKRILALLTALCLMLTLLPVSALAAAQVLTTDEGSQAVDLLDKENWTKDRTKPETWTIADGKIQFTVDEQQQSSSWYDWQGLKALTGLGVAGYWSATYTIEVDAAMLANDNTNASLWIQIDEAGGHTAESQQDCVDWAIIQFLNQGEPCWQSWDANGSGAWKTIEGLTPTEGEHTVRVTFCNGTIRQYIDQTLVNTYTISDVTKTAPAAVIAQARSHGASFDVSIGVPAFVMDPIEVYTADELVAAARFAGEGDTIVIMDNLDLNGSAASANNSTITVTSDGVTIDGNGKTITASNFTNKAHVLGIEGCNGVTVQDLTIVGDSTTKHGINVYKSQDVTLNDVTVRSVGGLGLMINASDVTATGALTLENNGWGAKINVGFGSNISGVQGSSFDASNATLTGVELVYADAGDVSRGGGKENFHIAMPDSYVDMGGETEIAYAPAVAEVDGVRYATLAAAIAGAAEGSTVKLLDDVAVTSKIVIDHSVTVDGDKHTISGNPNSTAAYFEVTNGDVTFQNATVQDFGGNASAVNGWGLFLVPSTAEKVNFTAQGLTVKNFNRGAFDFNAGTFTVSGCTIDCTNTYEGNALTKGVKAAYNATGTVTGTTITNSASSYEDWSSAGIELWDNAEVSVVDCQINNAVNGIYVYADSYAQLADTSAKLTVSNTTVDVQDFALQMGYVADEGISLEANIESGSFTGAIGISEYTYDTDGTPLDEIAHDQNTDYATISITGGTFTVDPSAFVASGYRVTGSNPYEVVKRTSSGGGSSVPTNPEPSEPDVSEDTTVTITVKPTVSGSTAQVELTETVLDETISSALDAAEKEGTAAAVEIAVSTPSSAKALLATLPAASLQTLSEHDDATLSITSDVGTLTMDAAAMASVADQAGESKITISVKPVATATLNAEQQEAVGEAPVYDLTVTYGDSVITSFGGGSVTVSLPYALSAGQDAACVVVWYMDDEGNLTACPSKYDAKDAVVTFTTTHFSKYVVGYDETLAWSNPFTDVAESDWFYDAVRYVNFGGLMNGYTDTTFAPDDTLSRAQLAQILYNMEKQPETAFAATFADVAESDWYASAVIWASSNGIVNGVAEGQFAPQSNVTREQLATMLYRHAGSPATEGSLDGFADAASVSAYAADAMAWAVEQGLITGMNDGSLNPQGNATRAQVATILMRLASL